MDKQLVEQLLERMPKPSLDKFIADVDGTGPCSRFLAGVRTYMQKWEHGRFQDAGRKGMAIPKYDPFMDHVTSLIVNDYQVQVRLGIGRFLGKLNVNDFYGGCTRLHKDFDVMVGKGRGLSPNPFTTWAK